MSTRFGSEFNVTMGFVQYNILAQKARFAQAGEIRQMGRNPTAAAELRHARPASPTQSDAELARPKTERRLQSAVVTLHLADTLTPCA